MLFRGSKASSVALSSVYPDSSRQRENMIFVNVLQSGQIFLV